VTGKLRTVVAKHLEERGSPNAARYAREQAPDEQIIDYAVRHDPLIAEALKAERAATLQRIKLAVQGYNKIHRGYEQWYVDEFCIDVDAAVFWNVVEGAINGNS
jgi:hypothetical protein